jgi:hypothetical protein
MEQVKIQQSSEIHPGRLTEADIKALQPPNGPPVQIGPAGVSHRADPTRRDAGSPGGRCPRHQLAHPEASRFPCKERPCMPESQTTSG